MFQLGQFKFIESKMKKEITLRVETIIAVTLIVGASFLFYESFLNYVRMDSLIREQLNQSYELGKQFGLSTMRSYLNEAYNATAILADYVCASKGYNASFSIDTTNKTLICVGEGNQLIEVNLTI